MIDDDIASNLGKMLWAEVINIFCEERKNAADIEINITAKEGKL